DGDDHIPFLGDADAIVDEIQEFLTGARSMPDPDRVLATVMFTDLVASTARAAELGDRPWREMLVEHQRLVRQELGHHRGREIKTTGDGFLATFDGPARAIRCAHAIRELTSQHLGIDVRAGLHTGEIELVGNDITGIAVHIAARVAALAAAGQVLVSRIVTDLVAGSGIEFRDEGEHTLKGVPGRWQLFAAYTPA
ncbi:MAG: hypothetical protein QOH28_480, partial [Actinomycetota bacterium]|nr:hypothetical protein [Actinomycetota bacterium]